MEDGIEKRTPQQMLEQQTDLLAKLLEQQQAMMNSQKEYNKAEIKWLEALLNEQRQQTAKLASISSIVTLWGVLMVIGIILAILGSCGSLLQ